MSKSSLFSCHAKPDLVQAIRNRFDTDPAFSVAGVEIALWADRDLRRLNIELKSTKLCKEVFAVSFRIELNSAVFLCYFLEGLLLPHHFRLNPSELVRWQLDTVVSRINDSNFGVHKRYVLVVVCVHTVVLDVVNEQGPLLESDVAIPE